MDATPRPLGLQVLQYGGKFLNLRIQPRESCSKEPAGSILAQVRLQPHRLERYMASNDPRFEEKAADIIGLYMDPPQHAAIFCVDEKTAGDRRKVIGIPSER